MAAALALLLAPVLVLPDGEAVAATIEAGQASGTSWISPGSALSADSNYASTSSDAATLSLSSFATGNFAGPITGVSLFLDRSQQNHLDDEFVLAASEAGCGIPSSWAPTFSVAANRAISSAGVDCPNGWTWARVQNLRVDVRTQVKAVVADGEFRIYHAWLEVTFTNANPIASAGPDQMVAEATRVVLDASGSSDPDNDGLTFSWSQVSGTAVTLTAAGTRSPSFTAPTLASGQTVLEFRVTVRDVIDNQATDNVRVTVQNANLAPLADAGTDVQAAAGARVELNGAGSRDNDGDPLTYQWTQTLGPSVTLSDRTAIKPTFTAPASAASLEFTLVVTDNSGRRSDPDLVRVAVAGGAASSPGASDDPPGSDPNAGDSSSTDDGANNDEGSGSAGPLAVVRLDPPRVLVGPDGDVEIAAQGFDATGQRVAIAECVWDANSAGGSMDDDGDCTRTFRAGDRLGTGYRLIVAAPGAAGPVSAGAEVIIAAVGEPTSAPADENEAPTCRAEFDPRRSAKETPVGFHDSCPIGLITLRWRDTPEEPVRLTTEPMAEWPDHVPQPPGRRVPGPLLDIRLEFQDGGAASPERATIRFEVPRTWVAAECPAASCEVRLFHFHDDAWTSLPAERTDEDDDVYEYAAETESFSYFVPGGIALATAPGGGSGFAWGTALSWAGLIASGLLIVLFVVKRITGTRRAAPARSLVEREPIPLPVVHGAAAAGPPATRLPVALRRWPTDLVPIVCETTAQFTPVAEKMSVIVEINGDAVSLPVVADRVRLGQATSILLDAAVRTAGKAGNVVVAIREQDGNAVVEITEEPGGAWPADVPRPIPKVDLGPVVAILEGHGGRCWVRAGKHGTTWGYMLPLRTAANALADDENGG